MPLPPSKAQEEFSKHLRKNTPSHLSLIDEVAIHLGINYDAAYRRVNCKVPFSLTEAVSLAEKYKISLNELVSANNINSYIVQESDSINSIKDFNTYFDNIYNEFLVLKDKDYASILFASREIPMFYFFDNPLLVRFKIYLWFYMINVTPIHKRISFQDFNITDGMLEKAQKVGAIYNRINVTEIWSFGALNNVLKQLIYFFQLKLINMLDAERICMALVAALNKINEYTIQKTETKRKYKLYNNEIIMNNNAIIFDFNGKKKFAYPYTLLKFFIVSDQQACKQQEDYLLDQLQYCSEITYTNNKEHTEFFNHKYDKINQALKLIRNENEKPVFL